MIYNDGSNFPAKVDDIDFIQDINNKDLETYQNVINYYNENFNKLYGSQNVANHLRKTSINDYSAELFNLLNKKVRATQSYLLQYVRKYYIYTNGSKTNTVVFDEEY